LTSNFYSSGASVWPDDGNVSLGSMLKDSSLFFGILISAGEAGQEVEDWWWRACSLSWRWNEN